MVAPADRGSRLIDEYIADLPRPFRRALQSLRQTIRKAAPSAVEVISYGMPAFRQNGVLVYFAAFKDHCSFFVGSATVRQKFKGEFAPFQSGKGTLRFTPEQPLPANLVRRVVRARVAENTARMARAGPHRPRTHRERSQPAGA